MEFSDNIGYLKRFLTLRDTNPIFDEVKENHWVGVPCFQFQDGSLSLDIDEVVKRAEEEVKDVSLMACSIRQASCSAVS